MKYYDGHITKLQANEVFVFGSNPEGRHWSGTAKLAKENFNAEVGVGRGLTGRCWALPTKNLTENYLEKETGFKYVKYGLRSISKEQIKNNIKDLYNFANKNKDLYFLIAYTKNGKNLNGYSGDEMFDMFNSFDIPDNIVFNSSFKI